jgi:hypothetical protein
MHILRHQEHALRREGYSIRMPQNRPSAGRMDIGRRRHGQQIDDALKHMERRRAWTETHTTDLVLARGMYERGVTG